MQIRGRRAIKRAQFTLSSPYGAPLEWSNCWSQSAGFNCIGPQGASKNIGLGQT